MKTVYLNGEYISLDAARISVCDRGFLLGEGVFETIRAYNGSPFAIDAHLDRLFDGFDVLGFAPPEDREELASATKKILNDNHLIDAYIRITISRGVEDHLRPTTVIFARPFVPYPENLYGEGAAVAFAEFSKNPDSPLGRIKSLSRLEYVLAKNRARSGGFVEAIFLSPGGNVLEGSVSNVFAIFNGRVVTPPLSENILAGVTRSAVLGLCASAGLNCAEERMGSRQLLEADEVFITNSLMEIMPVSKIGAEQIGDGRPGSITRKLRALFDELTKDTGK